MKLTQPSIRVLARTNETAADYIEKCARICYNSQPREEIDTPNEFVRRLINNGHLSPLEHWSITFKITCSIGIARELMRHRVASYSERSTRYVNLNTEDGIAFILPDKWTGPLRDTAIKYLETCEMLYNCAIKSGMQKQYARDLLPLCTATQFVMTANLREWLHIIELRTAPGAHPEMCKLMDQIRTFIPFG